jgi:hypothetical protein
VIILLRMDYEGDDLQRDLEKMNQINAKIAAKTGGKIDGPYLPQQHTLLYIFHVDKYERLNEAGRLWFAENAKLKLPFVPVTYEVAVTAKEFFG